MYRPIPIVYQVVDHQRLSAAGYCYSASAPPFVSAAASAALRMLRAEPALVSALRKNADFLHKAVRTVPGLEVSALFLGGVSAYSFEGILPGFFITGAERSLKKKRSPLLRFGSRSYVNLRHGEVGWVFH